MDNAEVQFCEFPLFDLFVHNAQSFCIFSRHHNTAGVAVDSINQCRAKDASFSGLNSPSHRDNVAPAQSKNRNDSAHLDAQSDRVFYPTASDFHPHIECLTDWALSENRILWCLLEKFVFRYIVSTSPADSRVDISQRFPLHLMSFFSDTLYIMDCGKLGYVFVRNLSSRWPASFKPMVTCFINVPFCERIELELRLPRLGRGLQERTEDSVKKHKFPLIHQSFQMKYT